MLLSDLPTDALANILRFVAVSTAAELGHANRPGPFRREKQTMDAFLSLATVSTRWSDALLTRFTWEPMRYAAVVEHMPPPWHLGPRWNALFEQLDMPLSMCMLNLDANDPSVERREVLRRIAAMRAAGRSKVRLYFGLRVDEPQCVWYMDPRRISYEWWTRIGERIASFCTALSVSLHDKKRMITTPVGFADLLHWRWPHLKSLYLEKGHSHGLMDGGVEDFVSAKMRLQEHSKQWILPSLRYVEVAKCQFNLFMPLLQSFVPKLVACSLGFAKMEFEESLHEPTPLLPIVRVDGQDSFAESCDGMCTVATPLRMAFFRPPGPSVPLRKILQLDEDELKNENYIVLAQWADGILTLRRRRLSKVDMDTLANEIGVSIS